MANAFVSYTHADEGLKEQFLHQLAPLQREGLIDVWHDRMLKAGEHLDATIQAELASSDLIVLLVSAPFLASAYCYEEEMKRAFARQSRGSAAVVSVILRPCQWKNVPVGDGLKLSDFLVVPKDGKAVTQWRDADEAFDDAVGSIRRLLVGSPGQSRSVPIQARPRAPLTPSPLPPDRELEAIRRQTERTCLLDEQRQAEKSAEFQAALNRYTDMTWSVQDEIDLQRRKREEAQRGYSEEWGWESAKREGTSKIQRDKPLGEALAYHVQGRWGCEFFEAVKEGLDPGGTPLERAIQSAYDAELTFWGKRTEGGVHEVIPNGFWADHHVDLFSLMRRKAMTVPNPGAASNVTYFDLMISRAQFEQVLPCDVAAIQAVQEGPGGDDEPPPVPPSERWVSLDYVVRYLAERSRWGVIQGQDDPYFSIKLASLLRDALACRDLTARGRYFHVLKGGVKDPPLHALVPIEPSFWETTHIDAYWALSGIAQNIGGRPVTNAVRQGDHEGMHDIRLDQLQVEALWPPRQSAFDAPKIPFANVRDLAAEYGFNLNHRDPGASNLAYEIEGELKEAAANNRLPVWGRPYQGPVRDKDPMVPIPAKHFLEYSFRHGALEHAVKNDQTCTTTMDLLVKAQLGKKGKTFYDLHLSTVAVRAIIKRMANERAEL